MMHRKLILYIIPVLILLTNQALPLATAQTNLQAITHYALTVYSEPNRSSAIIGVLIPRAKVILEGRNIDTGWILGRSTDGSVRGWMESRYLEYAPAVNVRELLISNETMFVPSTVDLSLTYRTIKLDDYPIIPTSLGRAQEIYELGQMYGTDPHSVAKVGDCISDNQHFLSPFGWKQYNLGSNTQLQDVIDNFSESLAYDSLAAYDGLVTTAVLDPLFANPLACLPGESPLRCEYRVHNASVAIIMFGAQDLLFTQPEEFDHNLRRIVHETVQMGIVPILSTFPGNLQIWERAVQYNQIVVQIALDYDIPLMNLWAALDALPNHGLNADGRHLSQPITYSGDLTDSNLQRGYPLRNLVTLQTLDTVWRNSMQ